MTTETTETQPETLETLAARLDHLDHMIHEIKSFIDGHREPLEKALRFLDPGRSVADYLKGRRRDGR